MKALSVKRPWAGLIFGISTGEITVDGKKKIYYALKDVENRPWTLWKYFKREDLPVRVYIHVPLKDDEDAMKWLMENGMPPIMVLALYADNTFPRSVIIGEVEIIDCVTDSKSPWAAEGQYHFILANPKKYEKPIPCKGSLGFFEPDIERKI